MIDPLPPGADRQQLWRWSMLAVLSLAVAGLTIIPFLLSKTVLRDESFVWIHAFGPNGLVVHVAMSFAVWFLTMFAALNMAMVPIVDGEEGNPSAGRRADQAGSLLAAIGTILILLAAFLDRGEATLNDYIPVIIDPYYYAGLALLGAGILLSALRMIIGLRRVTETTIDEIPVLLAAGLLYVAAVIGGLIAMIQLADAPLDFDYNQRLLWGAGHLLQFVNVGLILVACSVLHRRAFNAPMVSGRFLKWTSGLLLLGGLAGLGFYGVFPVSTARHLAAFTDLQYGLGLPVALVLLAVGSALWCRRAQWSVSDPAALSLLSAFLVFGVGAFLGLFVDGTDTRTPAHYHGVIGGLNLAFIGLFYAWFLPLLGRTLVTKKLVSTQIILYALGQLLFVIGMFAAGGMGETRKTTGSGIDLDNTAAILASGIREFGGALAVIGGLLFIVIALKALLGRPAIETT